MAKQLFTRHIQINHTPKHPGRNSSETFAIGFEPPEEMGSEYGDLYICYESHPNDRRLNPDNIIQGCGKAFYESGLETNFEKRFRMCLRALNELIIEAKTSCDVSLLAAQNDNLLFANVGNGLMVHARHGKRTDLSSETKPVRFAEIGQGKLSSGDKIILASQAVASSLTSKEIIKLLTDYPIDDIGSLLNDKLEPPKDIAYSYVVISCESTELDSTKLKSLPQQPETTTDTPTSAKLTIALQRFGSSIKNRSKKASTKVQKTAKSASSKIVPNVSSKTKHGWTSFWSKYINPNPRQAIIVVIITIIIIVVVIWGTSIIFNSNNHAMQQFEQVIALIDTAQSSLDKGNKESAKDNIAKANTILNSINSPEQQQINNLAAQHKLKTDFAAAQARVQTIEDKLTMTTRIGLDNAFTIPQTNLSSLIWTNGTLYGINPNDGSVIEINPLLGAPINRGSSSDLINSTGAQALNGGGLVAVGKSGLWQYTTASGLQQLKGSNLPQSVDVASYLNNIYLLSPGENQVVRYAKSGTNLTNRANILKNLSSGSLTNATSLAVSGNVFIARAKEIKLFEQGSERTYKVTGLPDSFGDFTKFYHNPDKGYFVILNKAGTRLALLSTESDSASFVRQYALSGDSPIQAFTIESASSQLMLSSNNKIVTNKIEK